MLHASLRAPGAIDALAKRWSESGNLRIEPFLAEDVAQAALAAMQGEGMTLKAALSPLRYQYFELLYTPEDACDHVLCRLGRWLWTDGVDLVSRITGMALGPPPARVMNCTLYTRGCYLDPHNDYDGERQVTYIIGMTREAWPADHGGHLEFLDVDPRRVTVRERRPPGWNTLDLFDVSEPRHIHRVPLVRHPADRRAITGWLYGAPAAATDPISDRSSSAAPGRPG